MFARYIVNGLNQRRPEMVLPRSSSRTLKRRWNDPLFSHQSSFSSLTWGSEARQGYPTSSVSSSSSSWRSCHETEPLIGQRRTKQQERGFHSSIPRQSERPIHTTASRFLSPATAAMPRLDDDEDDDANEELFQSHNNNWKSESMTWGDDRWYAAAGASSSSSSLSVSSLADQLGETNVWDMAAFVEDEEDEEEEENADEEEEVGSVSDATERHWRTPEKKQHPPTRKYSGVDVMKHFNVTAPPKTDNLEDLQLWLECESHLESTLKYHKVLNSARDRKDFASLPLVQRQLVKWHEPLKAAIEASQTNYVVKKLKSSYGPYMCALPAQKLAVVTAHEALTYLLVNGGKNKQRGVLLAGLALRIGEAVEEEVDVQRVLRKRSKESREKRASSTANSSSNRDEASDELDDDDHAVDDCRDNFDDMIETWTYGASHLRQFLEELNKNGNAMGQRRQASLAVKRARQLLDGDHRWPAHEKLRVGVALLNELFNVATVKINGEEEKAFVYERRKIKWQVGYVTLNEEFHKMVTEDGYQQLNPFSTRLKPMVIPSRKWVAPNDGGYCWLKVDLMRFHGCEMQREALRMADLSTVYDGLNVLGQVPWKINKEILDVAKKCWEENISLGDIPTQTNYEVPEEPVMPTLPNLSGLAKDSAEYKDAMAELQKFNESRHKYKRVLQKNMDLNSLRCSTVLKLNQADKFKDFEEIFFPFNMDFRGRAYPVPPHLSTVGSDLCRGLLKFAVAKPLGPRGLYWLKVHLANLAGKDKMSFDGRAAFVEKNIENIRVSVQDPFANRWWMELEDPFQGLAACHEIVKALDSGDPESYMCSLAVHMDGSCNGLQHYAALGRDTVGGRAVNLCNFDSPQDVYVGVMHEVIRRVAEEAAKTLDFADQEPETLSAAQKAELRRNKAAKLVDGLIDRGVVKRTVMTSVYGVTFIGARKQIQEKIEQKLEERGYDLDEINFEIYGACMYLAHLTMEVMGELFTGARQTMAWLTDCARLISHQGQPVAWVSPIGVPVVQPYRESRRHHVLTLLQKVTLVNSPDDLPIHKRRQVTAFPPNFIHSLDSSHMLLTGLEMDRRGLTFSAVHDSFWTHPCDVDEMNDILRDCFVKLYEQPLLERLKKSWEIRYPAIEFPDLPKRGDLDLKEVKSARYFFQ